MKEVDGFDVGHLNGDETSLQVVRVDHATIHITRSVRLSHPVDYIELNLVIDDVENEKRKRLKIETRAACFATPWRPRQARTAFVEAVSSSRISIQYNSIELALGCIEPLPFAELCFKTFGDVPASVLRAVSKRSSR